MNDLQADPAELFELILAGNEMGIGREEMIDRLVHDFPWLDREDMGVLVDVSRDREFTGEPERVILLS